MNDQVLDVPECYLEPYQTNLVILLCRKKCLKEAWSANFFFFLFNLILTIICKKLSKKVYDKTFSGADILF